MRARGWETGEIPGGSRGRALREEGDGADRWGPGAARRGERERGAAGGWDRQFGRARRAPCGPGASERGDAGERVGHWAARGTGGGRPQRAGWAEAAERATRAERGALGLAGLGRGREGVRLGCLRSGGELVGPG